MTYPKLADCPKCGNSDNLAVYAYDSWRHVECVKCNYLGPGEGNITQAIRSHNKHAAALAAALGEAGNKKGE